MSHSIALLATGDEVQNGDIINTNAQRIARLLSDHQFEIGEHLVAGDDHQTMVRALQYLLAHHQAIIITGGLGPTEDDRTRFALAEVLGVELIFFDEAWDNIVTRLHRLGLTVPENNRQQALFPKDAIIIANLGGTAAGCKVSFGDRIIYMLPGPPSECLPMMQHFVLPDLLQQGWQGTEASRYWRLYALSESHLAEWVEPLLANEPCRIGYRLDFPYIEFKLFAKTKTELERIAALLEPRFSEYYLVDSYIPATTKLKERLSQTDCKKLVLKDNVTRGKLAEFISSPDTAAKLDLVGEHDENAVIVTLQGLEAYWHKQQDVTSANFTMHIRHGKRENTESYELPYRFQRTIDYARELAAAKILAWL